MSLLRPETHVSNDHLSGTGRLGQRQRLMDHSHLGHHHDDILVAAVLHIRPHTAAHKDLRAPIGPILVAFQPLIDLLTYDTYHQPQLCTSLTASLASAKPQLQERRRAVAQIGRDLLSSRQTRTSKF